MFPHRLAGGRLVASNDLVLTALLLGVEEIAADREGRPAWSDRPTPQLDRRRGGPVGLDMRAGDDSVAIGSAKPGPIGSRLRFCQGRQLLSNAGRMLRKAGGCIKKEGCMRRVDYIGTEAPRLRGALLLGLVSWQFLLEQDVNQTRSNNHSP